MEYDREDAERNQDALWSFANLPVDIQEALSKKMAEVSSLEEFISSVMVGDCPKCGSEKTCDEDDLKELGDILKGICLACGHIFCVDCGGEYPCTCWEEKYSEGD